MSLLKPGINREMVRESGSGSRNLYVWRELLLAVDFELCTQTCVPSWQTGFPPEQRRELLGLGDLTVLRGRSVCTRIKTRPDPV